MNLEISAPYQENENYVFNILSNAQKLEHQSTMPYRLHQQGDTFDLSITTKDELQYFNCLRSTLIDILFQEQENWFEDKFSLDDLDNMFFEYLKPNFRENCIDLKCNFSNEIKLKYESIEKEESYMDILPKLLVHNISFDGKRFYINVECTDFERIHDTTNTVQVSKGEENEDKEDTEMYITSEEEEETLPKVQKETQDLCEVELDSNDLETMDMNLSEDDYYIVYKTINQEIKNNIVHSLNNIFESKGINLGDLNINDIIYDSDSDSDTSEESENDFEENYKTIVSS